MTNAPSPWHEGTCNRCKNETTVAVANMPGIPFSQPVCLICLAITMAGGDPLDTSHDPCDDYQEDEGYCAHCNWPEPIHQEKAKATA